MKNIDFVGLWCLICAFVLFCSTPVVGRAEESSVIVEKNLFSPDRKPPEQSTTSEINTSEPFENEDLQLYGIIIYETPRGLEKKAILSVNKKFLPPDIEDRYLFVKEGESIGPFKVVSIEKNKISVEYSEKSYVISLYSPAKKNTSPPPPIPAPLQPHPSEKEKSEPAREGRISFEEFKRLSPEEKEKLIERMKQAFVERMEKMSEKESKNEK
ncbi:hypothetical protein [Thermodesulforhabdus norvegica]|uniref:Uncharacterized protein n=1 Tax=Thermodesulforhabdus norvegica TaxID=39841 RepID=A0A1I4QNS6_9BACT|nr:hypothetical protein [Thermodesulforhabdus norvegica]SFM41360.1 hypothetical protein SAMN05660836_00122 [Thermodesulforhabdus norvegica]